MVETCTTRRTKAITCTCSPTQTNCCDGNQSFPQFRFFQISYESFMISPKPSHDYLDMTFMYQMKIMELR